jgi:hypothetical protein
MQTPHKLALPVHKSLYIRFRGRLRCSLWFRGKLIFLAVASSGRCSRHEPSPHSGNLRVGGNVTTLRSHSALICNLVWRIYSMQDRLSHRNNRFYVIYSRNNGTTGLHNPFLGNGSVNTHLRSRNDVTTQQCLAITRLVFLCSPQ